MSKNHVYDHLLHVAPFALHNNTIGAGLGSGWAFYFYLNTAINSTEFIALYDMYRVVSIHWKFIPAANSNDMSALDSVTNPAHLGACFYTQDQDDSTVPTALTDISEYAGLKVIRYGDIFTLHEYKPTITAPVSESGLSVKVSPWLDCSTGATIHRGFKMFQSDCQVGTNALYTVLMSVHVQFKSGK